MVYKTNQENELQLILKNIKYTFHQNLVGNN